MKTKEMSRPSYDKNVYSYPTKASDVKIRSVSDRVINEFARANTTSYSERCGAGQSGKR